MIRAALALLLAAPAAAAPGSQACDTRGYPLSSPTARFQDNADGTVTDTRTRLMWMRCSAGQAWSGARCTGRAEAHGWAQAQAQAVELNRRGTSFFADWRLPSLRELATISERQCENPRVNLDVFPGTPAERYWTATSRSGAAAGAGAFALSFGPQGVEYHDKQEAMHVRFVRDAR